MFELPRAKDSSSSLTPDQEEGKIMLMQGHKLCLLNGYAGTGKTYLIDNVKHELKGRRIITTAPTHKAVRVANGDATIHSYLSLKITYKQDKQVLKKKPFQDNIMPEDVVIIDESSMVSTELLSYILDAQKAYRLKIIFVGDFGQIPPVGEQYSPVSEIDCPSHELIEIVRQAKGSKIIQLATAIRNNTAYSNGIKRFVDNQEVFFGGFNDMQDFFVSEVKNGEYPHTISFRNKIVDSANRWARNIVMGFPKDPFLVGEKVYIRTADEDQIHKLEDIVEIANISKPYVYTKAKFCKMTVVDVEVRSYKGEEVLTVPYEPADAEALTINKSKLADQAWAKKIPWGTFWKFSKSVSEIKHIYAMTCHRSQGSTFGSIIVNCNDIPENRLLYTAVTRASKKVFLFNDKI